MFPKPTVLQLSSFDYAYSIPPFRSQDVGYPLCDPKAKGYPYTPRKAGQANDGSYKPDSFPFERINRIAPSTILLYMS